MITLDLPVAPSVNRTRKIDWRGLRAVRLWMSDADRLVLSQGRMRRHVGTFELTVTVDGKGIDLDNGLKSTIDYLRRIEVIEDDSPRFMKALHVIVGSVPPGMIRVEVRPWPDAVAA